ncbi:hypothetical protein D9758_016497 [Tetrapyrgos nigripes]|uniref:Uncharacterized protein n=1 Tax=Tetrapyrgos nigripes TaxID=182062 RepID=A0A8H5CK97_9AGAR|nr:hypothetical protein D9758_016497 [Tetrapyrgos nigripes]
MHIEGIIQKINGNIERIDRMIAGLDQDTWLKRELLDVRKGLKEFIEKDIRNPEPIEGEIKQRLLTAKKTPEVGRFEAYVDSLVNTFLNWYCPGDQSFIVRPQWTYRNVADPEQVKIQDEWSNIANVSYTPSSQAAFAVGVSRTSTPPPPRSMKKAVAPTTEASQKVSEVDIHVDEDNRAVTTGKGRIRRPDFVAALMRSIQDDLPLIIVEDKLSRRSAARKQLLEYMEDFRDVPYLLGMAFVLDEDRLVVGLFEKAVGKTNPIQLKKGTKTWFSPTDPFVHGIMVRVINYSRGFSTTVFGSVSEVDFKE